MQRHEHGGVGVFPVAAGTAHAVGAHAARLRRGGEHLTARTHTERVRARPVRQVAGETIVRRGQTLRRRAVLRGVDVCLPVLDAYAHGKRLRLHRNALCVQHFECVARAVADREDDLLCRERVVHAGAAHGQRRDVSVLRGQPGHPVTEAHLAAARDDLVPEALHDLDEHVRADVGLGVIGDVLRRAVRRKLREHEADARVVRAGVELAVGECARAALAELHVALGVERAARAKRGDLCAARPGVRSALEYDGVCARARKQERGKHPRRAEAHDHGARLRRCDVRDGIGLFVGDRGAAAAADETLLVPAHGHADGVDIADVVLFARVERFFADAQTGDVVGRDLQHLGCQRLERRLVRTGGKLQVRDRDHRQALPAARPLAHAHCRL